MLFTRLVLISLAMLILSACDSDQAKDSPQVSKHAVESIWKNAPYESTSVTMELEQVSPRAYYVQGPAGTPTDNEGFITNAGVVVTEDGVVVLDSLGTPSLAYLLLSKIREITDKPVKKVVVTHYHADHIYGLQVFKEAGAEIIAPEGAKQYLDSEAAEFRLRERRESLFPWVDENTYLVQPDKYVKVKETFTLGGVDFVIDPVGSTHSQGDLTMHVVQENVLYAGDLIFEGRIPFVAGANPERWMEKLSTMDAKVFNIIVPGHGAASVSPEAAIKFTLEYLEFLHNNLSRAVENMQPFDEAYNSMDWSKYKDMPASQANRMNAYYVYLGLEASSVAE